MVAARPILKMGRPRALFSVVRTTMLKATQAGRTIPHFLWKRLAQSLLPDQASLGAGAARPRPAAGATRLQMDTLLDVRPEAPGGAGLPQGEPDARCVHVGR